MIRTCRFRYDGCRQVTNFFKPSDAFGVEPGHYRANAEAVTDAVVRSYPHSGNHLTTVETGAFLFRALRHANDCIDLLGRRSASARLAAFLLRFDNTAEDGSSLFLPMSREDIADHLALTVETVSRTFSEFHRRGVIASRTPHLINIEDRNALSVLAGNEYRSQVDDPHSRCVA